MARDARWPYMCRELGGPRSRLQETLLLCLSDYEEKESYASGKIN